MTHQPRRRPAFTLMEMLAVMTGLAACLFVGGAMIVTVFKADRAGQSAGNRLSWRSVLAEQFRADVARAEAAPAKSGELVAGADCLILQLPGGGHIVYRWRKDALTRSEGSDERETHKTLPVGLKGSSAEFVRPGGRLLTLRITERPRTGPARASDLSAALGGDLQ